MRRSQAANSASLVPRNWSRAWCAVRARWGRWAAGLVAGLAAAKMLLVVAMSVVAARTLGGLSVPVGSILKALVASAAAEDSGARSEQ